MNVITDERPSLAIYVVWHPTSDIAATYALSIFRELCSDPDSPAHRGLGIPVRFRTSNDPHTSPNEIPFGLAKHTAVFVLVDDALASAVEWRDFLSGLTNDAGEEDLVVSASLTAPSNLPPSL